MRVALGLAVLMLIAPASALTFQSHGTFVDDGDADHAQPLTTLAQLGFSLGAQVCRVDVSGNSDGGGIYNDAYYLHWGADCSGSIEINDLRLVKVGNFAAGTWVAAGDLDRGNNLDATVGGLTAKAAYLEADGIPGYTMGDMVYISADASLDATNADLRLTTISSLGNAGTVVRPGDQKDVTEANDGDGVFPEAIGLASQGSFALRVIDKDGDGAFDRGTDQLVLSLNPGTFPKATDILLGKPGNHGSVLKETSNEVVRVLDVLTGVKAFTTDTVTSPIKDRHLYLHFGDNDGTDDHILQGDVVLKGASGSFGSAVASTGYGDVIDGAGVTFVSEVFWLDADGNDHFTPGHDPVYLNRKAALGGSDTTISLTAGDLRLTKEPLTNKAAGTVVATGDQDLDTYGSLTANDGITGAWFLLRDPGDPDDSVPLRSVSNVRVTGDSSWTQSHDGVYGASASTVEDDVLRVFVPARLTNAKVHDCDGNLSLIHI